MIGGLKFKFKKGPKGPNPLSMKKKKPKERPPPGVASTSGENISAGSKRKLEQVVTMMTRKVDTT
jgi:U3 small nucleolar RNA-associated protein 23